MEINNTQITNIFDVEEKDFAEKVIEDSVNKLRERFAQRKKEVRKKYVTKSGRKAKDKRKNNKLPKEMVSQPINNKEPINKKPIPPSDIKDSKKDAPPKKSRQ